MKIYRPREVSCLAGLLLLTALLAANWPQWRGPERDGTSSEKGLLQKWPAEGPKLVWHIEGIGDGYSTPSVVDDRLYVISNRGLEDEFVQAIGTADGKQIWETRIGKVGEPDQQPSYPAARSTPTVDGDWIYVLGSDGDLACLARGDGKIRWTKNVRTEFGGEPGEWAYSESPLIDGDRVVCSPGGKEATLLALDKTNGEVIWKSEVPGGDKAGYASIVIAEADGVKQYVQFLGGGVVGVDADTGKFLWRYDRTGQGPANIQTPVTRDGLVYSAGGRAGGALIRLKSENGRFDVEEVYFDSKLPTAIGGAVLVGDYLYGTTRATMVCVDFKTGEIQWTHERGLAPASICYADGQLFLHGENGDVGMVEATPEKYIENGRFTPPEVPEVGNSKAWAYPVVSQGRLYIRDMGSLWCYDVEAK